MHLRTIVVATLLCAAGTELHAQQVASPRSPAVTRAGHASTQQVASPRSPAVTRAGHASTQQDSVMTRGWSTLRVAKWTTAIAAAGTAIYGFTENQRADRAFEQLEQVCVDEPIRCDGRLPNGAYADLALEAEYQDVRGIDRRARTALVAGQIGVAASVVMFIIDLRNSSPPANIPYEPRTFEMMPARDGGVSLRMNVRLPAVR